MPSLSVTCIETRDHTKAAIAVRRTVGCIPVDCVYWFSDAAFPFVLPGIPIVHVAIPPFTDFVEDINGHALQPEALAKLTAIDPHTLPILHGEHRIGPCVNARVAQVNCRERWRWGFFW